ncbi:LysM peptidoglycan-binding domain-containing protein [Solwaraspora sp. WMMD406]|uniref:LysM peptidoglycan-binding domain-containing protein n=1 Tax=Solwaraspora sp. WMMD406 TaxID=3016095 RepID=UPI00241693E1|nr:LysM peptidoglycan-binding domain-containing protein [Solwaraspora sp. WMMD406]MDG4763186.1 LysM peptidoglycan-binding domain-containing protein [Solwaraspora sp. WMMD406]
MRAPRVSPARRLGQVITGLSALIVLLILIAGAPVALIAFAGNPLPDHVPGFAEIGTALTSRDDGQLFLKALAVVGWLGWATFLISVLVELPAQLLRRPAPRLPGLSRQQRVAAALIGSISLILVATPAAAFTAPGPAESTVVTAAASIGAAPATDQYATAGGQPLSPNQLAVSTQHSGATTAGGAGTPGQYAPTTQTVPTGHLVSPAALTTLAATPSTAGQSDEAPVYQVAKGDYLGHIAGRYLGEFGDYRQLAALNEIDDPDQIRAGQLLRLPTEATDSGVRPHANGTVVTPPGQATPRPAPVTPEAPPAAEAPTAPADQPSPDAPSTPGTAPAERPSWQIDDDGAGGNLGGGVSAGRSGPEQNLNRPLAVAAVITAASIIGAQIGTVLGLKRRTAGTTTDSGRHRRYRD